MRTIIAHLLYIQRRLDLWHSRVNVLLQRLDVNGLSDRSRHLVVAVSEEGLHGGGICSFVLRVVQRRGRDESRGFRRCEVDGFREFHCRSWHLRRVRLAK